MSWISFSVAEPTPRPAEWFREPSYCWTLYQHSMLWGHGFFARSGGSVGARENCSEVGFRPFAGIWLEFALEFDDESGAGCGEQTGLRMWSMLGSEIKGTGEPTKSR